MSNEVFRFYISDVIDPTSKINTLIQRLNEDVEISVNTFDNVSVLYTSNELSISYPSGLSRRERYLIGEI